MQIEHKGTMQMTTSTTGTKSIYLPDDVYHALKDKLAQMVAEPFERFCSDPDTEVVTALGEIGDIWPQSVVDDAETA